MWKAEVGEDIAAPHFVSDLLFRHGCSPFAMRSASRNLRLSKYPPAKPGALDREPLKAAMQHAEIISDRSLPSRVHTIEAASAPSARAVTKPASISAWSVCAVCVSQSSGVARDTRRKPDLDLASISARPSGRLERQPLHWRSERAS
jgi:hypothetical protein